MTIEVLYGFNVSVTFFKKGGYTYVKVLSPGYVEKERVMPHCYSEEYSTYGILKNRDFHKYLKSLFGEKQ